MEDDGDYSPDEGEYFNDTVTGFPTKKRKQEGEKAAMQVQDAPIKPRTILKTQVPSLNIGDAKLSQSFENDVGFYYDMLRLFYGMNEWKDLLRHDAPM